MPDQNWQVAGVGDFDGDGRDDILWRHGTSGENYAYLMNGLSIVNEGYLRTVADMTWQITGVGDFNGDGKADILWRHATSGENYLYVMNGLSIANEGYLRTVADAAWQIKGIGDFNGDGRADILWRNATSGENYLARGRPKMTARFRSLVKSLLVSAVLVFVASATANAATIHMRAWVDGAQAVGGTGVGTFTFDTVTKVLTWSITSQGLSGPCTAAHFHGPAPAGVNNNPVVTIPCSASPLTGSSAPLNTTHEAQLLSGQWYINIHTGDHGSGEIRGQVVRLRGDFNADGKADILWRNSSSGENYLYPMDGTAILPGEGYLRTVADQSWRVAGVGDFNGDGTADILWRNSASGENYLYLMSGTSIIGEGYLRTVADQNWQVAGGGDFNGDGAADILWRNSATGENYLFFMSGATIVGEGDLRTVADQNWRVAEIGDFNGNGRADILWRNESSGENYLYLMDGTTIAEEGYIRTVADLNWVVAGVADFDGDGRADILWRNFASGENYLYPMAGMAIRSTEGYLRTVADMSWRIVALGDFDGDGRADILWRNSSNGENYIYLMSGKSIAGEGYVRTVAQASWQVQYPPSQDAAPTQTVTLPPVRDNTLYQDPANNSNGAGPNFYVGQTRVGSIRRGLLKFDLSSIPAGATITSATLTLHLSMVPPGAGAGENVTLHRLLGDWGEGGAIGGGQGAPAEANDATWLHRFYPNILWSTPGGDFAATPSATTEVDGIASYSWSGSGVAADVQQWLANPAANFGWLLRGNEAENSSARQYDSREHPTAAFRPRLVVKYTAPQ